MADLSSGEKLFQIGDAERSSRSGCRSVARTAFHRETSSMLVEIYCSMGSTFVCIRVQGLLVYFEWDRRKECSYSIE
jgi:hypothetical protein